jgi:hypothetical protein
MFTEYVPADVFGRIDNSGDADEKEVNLIEFFSPRLTGAAIDDLSTQLERELWSITNIKSAFKTEGACTKLAMCQGGGG